MDAPCPHCGHVDRHVLWYGCQAHTDDGHRCGCMLLEATTYRTLNVLRGKESNARTQWERANKALAERDVAILHAFDAGAGYEDIVGATGLTKWRVSKILSDTRRALHEDGLR